jgi:hypothetical protein
VSDCHMKTDVPSPNGESSVAVSVYGLFMVKTT